jgi:hypothetical protein
VQHGLACKCVERVNMLRVQNAAVSCYCQTLAGVQRSAVGCILNAPCCTLRLISMQQIPDMAVHLHTRSNTQH